MPRLQIQICSLGDCVDRSDGEAFVRGLMAAGDRSAAVSMVDAMRLSAAFPPKVLSRQNTGALWRGREAGCYALAWHGRQAIPS